MIVTIEIRGAAYTLCATALLAITATASQAETALEAVVRESKNTRVDPLRVKSGQNKAAINASGKAQEAVAPRNEKGSEVISQKPLPLLQRVDEIVVEAQREPEDVSPPEKPAFQKMKESLDNVGRGLAPSIVESQSNGGNRTAVFKVNGTCYAINNNAGRMNNDGSLGSAGQNAETCTTAQARAPRAR